MVGVGSGGAAGWEALKRQVKADQRRQAQRAAKREERRSHRPEYDADDPFVYEVEPADHILARELRRSRKAVVGSFLLALSLVALEVYLTLFGAAPLHLIAEYGPPAGVATVPAAIILCLNSLSFARLHRRQFPDDRWLGQRVSWYGGLAALAVHLVYVVVPFVVPALLA